MVIPGSTLALSVLCLSWMPPVFFGWLSCPEHAQQTSGRGNETDTSGFSVAAEQVKRIAIIGAGTGGIAALKTFLHDIPKPEGQRWEIELFERRSGLGGQWLPDDGSARYPYLPATPLYPQLHTNSPAPRMTYPGFTFPPYTPLFPSHEHALSYLDNFATHFNLHPYIHLNHSLESAYWVGNSSTGFWELSISAGGSREIIPLNETSLRTVRRRSRFTKHFDHLVVTIGHYHYPSFPSWATDDTAKEWLQNGEGRHIQHSMYFRRPEEYAEKVILVVGGGSSGNDVAAWSGGYAKKVYHSHGSRAPSDKIPNAIYKPRTKGFTPSSVQFEDGTEASDVEIVILATGYEYRFPFLDPSDPYNRPADDVLTHKRQGVVTTNASASRRSKGEERLTTNLKYVFPLDRHIVSLSPLHPLNALLFIGLTFNNAYAPSTIAQSLFAGHLISQPSRVYPTTHVTGHEGWNETSARELLLNNLTAFENRLASKGFDVYRLGHSMNLGWYTEAEYQDSLIAHLQSKGLVPERDRGYVFAEPWRTWAGKNRVRLRRIWKEVESRGQEEAMRWLDGVETEGEWADLMYRLAEWGEEHKIQ